MAVITINDDDLRRIAVTAVQAIGRQRAASPASEDDDPLAHAPDHPDRAPHGHPRKAAGATRRTTTADRTV